MPQLKKVVSPQIFLNIVSCRGVVQLGGPDPWYNQGGTAKVGLVSLSIH